MAFSAVLSACGRRSWIKSLQIFDLIESPEPRLKNLQELEKTMKKPCHATKDVVSITAGITATGSLQSWPKSLYLCHHMRMRREALRCFSRLKYVLNLVSCSSPFENRIWKLQQCRQVPMNLITLTSILNACEPGGRWDLALEQL